MKVSKSIFIFLLASVLTAPGAWAQSSMQDEIQRSERLAEVFREAAVFHFGQLEDFYLPQLSKSAWLLGAQRSSLAVAAVASITACMYASLNCAEVAAPALLLALPIAGLTVSGAGLILPFLTVAEGYDLLKYQDAFWGWPEGLLKENLDRETRLIVGNLLKDYFVQLECNTRYEAYLECSSFSLSDVENYLRDFDELYFDVISTLRERVETDPSISLEVRNINHYLNKPGRYLKYFRYMSLISFLEGFRYHVLSDLHTRRAELLRAQVQ